MTSRSSGYVTLIVALLISLAHGEVTQCSPSHTQPKLRFVAQLSINGCPIFVHDTGANDGPHFAVEPLMCVTQSLHKVLPRYDPITQQTYVSVPVMLRDDAMLTEVEHQLRHLSPKSVKFATVSDVGVSTDNSSGIQAMGFDWSPGDSIGILRMGCVSPFDWQSSLRMKSLCSFAKALSVKSRYDFPDSTLSIKLRKNEFRKLPTTMIFKYQISMQNKSFFDPNFATERYDLPICNQLRFVKSIRIKNYTARVHQRLDMKGHFVIEPLLCHNITSITNESIMYDYSRDMYYLKLDVVLQDDITLDAVRSKLADLSPLNVTFMRLWRAESVVASALSRRFEIGGLMVSGDWRSGQVRVYCRAVDDCKRLMSHILIDETHFWKHIKSSLTLLATQNCLLQSEGFYYYSRLSGVSSDSLVAMPEASRLNLRANVYRYLDGRLLVFIQQRITGSVSFQRTWAEYERGFGDDTDFWLGLSAIHSLSINGTTLRVEMKLWNGTELHAEYAGFKVGDASTNYRMTYREMIRDRSSFSWDGLEYHKGSQFSTMDRDNDNNGASCSNSYGKGGWWFFSGCHNVNPNGVHGSGSSNIEYMIWHSGSAYLPLREVRLMLQI